MLSAMLVQNSLHLMFYFVGIVFSTNQVKATPCQEYPSEYAYLSESVNRAESGSANCRRYPPSSQGQSIHPEHYVHCDGTQLRLTDSNLGQEQYHKSEHYQWPAGDDREILFIFPTRVFLTTITLHYYSDSIRGLPRLRFYAVPDNFNIWDAATIGTSRADVAAVQPGRESEGGRSISINFNFTTKKMLMYKYRSSYRFALSETEFFNCEKATTSTLVTTTSSKQTGSDFTAKPTTTAKEFVIGTTVFTESMSTMLSFITTDAKMSTLTVQSKSVTGNQITAIGVSIAILLIISITLIITVVVLICSYKRRAAKKKFYTDSSYSTLNRGSGLQVQPQQDSTQLYDQIHLSPSTGQTEFIPKSETANINNPNTTPQNSHPTHSTADDDRAKHSSALNAANQAITSQLSQKAHESTHEQPTHAAVDKSKKKKFKKQTKKIDPKNTAAEKGPPVSPYRNEVPHSFMQEKKETTKKQEICPSHTIEELYTDIKKKPKGSEPKDEEETPPIPLHTVEELYTAVQKKPKSNADENKEAPSHTVLQYTAEDLYTAVIKKPNDGSMDDAEAAPPLPPCTVEELYTAVIKKPKESAEDEEKAPPIPPYTMEKN